MAVRIDKYLWSIRLFKTRSIATEAVKKGKIQMGGNPVKPSRTLAVGDVFEVRLPMITRKFRVVAELHNRVGAKLVADYVTEITSAADLKVFEEHLQLARLQRNKGLGRPTKKERRDIDRLMDKPDDWDSWLDWEFGDEDEDKE